MAWCVRQTNNGSRHKQQIINKVNSSGIVRSEQQKSPNKSQLKANGKENAKVNFSNIYQAHQRIKNYRACWQRERPRERMGRQVNPKNENVAFEHSQTIVKQIKGGSRQAHSSIENMGDNLTTIFTYTHAHIHIHICMCHITLESIVDNEFKKKLPTVRNKTQRWALCGNTEPCVSSRAK